MGYRPVCAVIVVSILVLQIGGFGFATSPSYISQTDAQTQQAGQRCTKSLFSFMTIPLAFGQSCTPGEEVEFDASASNPDPSKIKIYKWDFESGGKVDETGSRVRHAFDTTDWTYTITFTIEDDIGQTASTKTTIKPIHHTSPQPESKPGEGGAKSDDSDEKIIPNLDWIKPGTFVDTSWQLTVPWRITEGGVTVVETTQREMKVRSQIVRVEGNTIWVDYSAQFRTFLITEEGMKKQLTDWKSFPEIVEGESTFDSPDPGLFFIKPDDMKRLLDGESVDLLAENVDLWIPIYSVFEDDYPYFMYTGTEDLQVGAERYSVYRLADPSEEYIFHVHPQTGLVLKQTFSLKVPGEPTTSPSPRYATLESFPGSGFIILEDTNVDLSQQTSEPILPIQPGGECLIATAAFGSELAPQVQFLRNFRDTHIMSTLAGSSFMSVFNIWYYSFSPHVADYERGQPWLQNTVKTSIYPLITILQTSEKANSSIDGEYGAVAAGFIASFMIGALYFWPFAISIRRVRTNRFNYKLALTMIAVVFVGIISSLASGNEYALMVSTSLFVLTLVSVSAVLSAKLIVTVFNTVGSMMAKGDVRSRV